MDVLTEVLESIRVRSLISGRLECTAPWGLAMRGDRPSFIVVARGSCELKLDGVTKPVTLAGGDFVLLPKAQPHTIRDQARSAVRPAHEVLKACPGPRGCQPGGVFRIGGGGAQTTLVGGCFEMDAVHGNPLLNALPPMIHVRGDRGTPVQWLESTLQFIASEMASGQPGAETVVGRLADILFVQAVRAYVAEQGEQARGWLRALVDGQIGQALSLIHEHPEQAWTVESLASKVAMSRSAFSARFTDLVEEPPLTYLTRWRMTKASRLLRAGTATMGEIAGQVGYDAEAAFSKAFKRWMGTAPGAYRRGEAHGS